MSQKPDEEDEEQQQSIAAVARKAWGAGHRDRDSDHFEDPAFRGVRPGGNAKPGGAQTVKPEDTVGSMDLCWCGLPFDHDWPGKNANPPLRHPRNPDTLIKEETMATAAAPPTEEQPRIERRALRAYHADLADVILTAVNEYHVKYRITPHSVILFPPDQSKPYAINARNSDRQVKGARIWMAKHCVPLDQPIKQAARPAPSTKPVDEATVKELAEALNSPEHLHDEPAKTEAQADPPQQPSPTMVATKKTAAKAAPANPQPVDKPVEEPTAADFAGVQGVQPSDVADAEGWMPYIKSKSKEAHPHMLINAEGKVKCKLCGDILPGRKSVAGHLRTHHSDTTTLWGPQAKEKAVTTYFTNKAKGQVEEAIGILQNAMGIEPPKVDTSEMEAEIKALRAQVKELSGGSAEIKALTKENEQLTARNAELTTKLADLEAKQALLRETLGL